VGAYEEDTWQLELGKGVWATCSSGFGLSSALDLWLLGVREKSADLNPFKLNPYMSKACFELLEFALN